MGNIFIKVLNLSITTGILVLVIILLRELLKRKSRIATCWLWILVALRLIIPVSIESPYGLLNPEYINLSMENDAEENQIPLNNLNRSDEEYGNEKIGIQIENSNITEENVTLEGINRGNVSSGVIPQNINNQGQSSIIKENDKAVDKASSDNFVVNNSTNIKVNNTTDNNTKGNNTEYNNTKENSTKDNNAEDNNTKDNNIKNITTKSNNAVFIFSILGYIWLLGVIGMLSYMVIAYFKIKRITAVSLLYGLYENVSLCDDISTPFIYGIFKPMIYLPSNIEEKYIENIVAHERNHILRHDNMWKLLGFCLLAVNWFNPLMWLAFSLFSKDIEYACDEQTVKNMSAEERRSYAEALFSTSMLSGMAIKNVVAFSEGSVKERIVSIKKYKKAGAIVIAITVVLILVVGIVFFVKPSNSNDSTKDKSPDQVVENQQKNDENVIEENDSEGSGSKEEKLKEDGIKGDNSKEDKTKEDKTKEDIHFGEKTTVNEIMKTLGADQPLYISFFNEMADGHVITNEPRYVSFDKITKAMNQWPELQQITDTNGINQSSLLDQCTDGMNNNFGIDVYGDNKRATIKYKMRMVNEKLAVYAVNGSDEELFYLAEFTEGFIPPYYDMSLLYFEEEEYDAYVSHLTEYEKISGVGTYQFHRGYLIDLDGDGTDEELFVTEWGWDPENTNLDSDSVWMWPGVDIFSGERIYINGICKYAVSNDDGVYPVCFAITDINKRIPGYEILIDASNKSEQRESRFYHYQDGEIPEPMKLGVSFLERGTGDKYSQRIFNLAGFDGEGSIYGVINVDGDYGLGHHVDVRWKVGEDYEPVIDMDVSYPKSYFCTESGEITETMVLYYLRFPIYVIEENSTKSSYTLIKKQSVYVDKTDRNGRIHISSIDGSEGGWIDFNNLDEHLTDEGRAYRDEKRDWYIYPADIIFTGHNHYADKISNIPVDEQQFLYDMTGIYELEANKKYAVVTNEGHGTGILVENLYILLADENGKGRIDGPHNDELIAELKSRFSVSVIESPEILNGAQLLDIETKDDGTYDMKIGVDKSKLTFVSENWNQLISYVYDELDNSMTMLCTPVAYFKDNETGNTMDDIVYSPNVYARLNIGDDGKISIADVTWYIPK